MQEIEEIMDEEENNDNNLIEMGSTALMHLATLHIPNIRAYIRKQITDHVNNKEQFDYYLEIRSFIDERCTKVGMFDIGDGNTEVNPDASMFLYTIPYVFTTEALRQFLTFTINTTGIHEYAPCKSEGVFIISDNPTNYSRPGNKKASVELSSTYNK